MTKPTIQNVASNLHGILICFILVIVLAMFAVASCGVIFITVEDDIQYIGRAVYEKKYSEAVAGNTVLED